MGEELMKGEIQARPMVSTATAANSNTLALAEQSRKRAAVAAAVLTLFTVIAGALPFQPWNLIASGLLAFGALVAGWFARESKDITDADLKKVHDITEQVAGGIEAAAKKAGAK